MDNAIKLSLPHMGGKEQYWVNQAFETNWVVPLGPNVDEFERLLGEYIGAPGRVVALSAGTAALHLGLVMLGVKAGDEVMCQSFTFSASANPITYQGARPVFVGSEPDTWNMDPEALDRGIADRIKVTGRKPVAIIPVHLYGMPAKMDEILAVAAKWDIPVLEDAAEALGSEYKGRKCGTLGKYGALSFNGNKIITTSGGGALVCPDEESARRVKFYATQARENRPYYYHTVIGYNYRMSNVCAGIGVGQMDVLQEHVDRRRTIHDLYTWALDTMGGLSVQQNPSDSFHSNFWLSTLLIDPATGHTPDELRLALADRNIESRLLWRPMHMQPVFADAPYYGNNIEDELFGRGLCLPSGSVLSDADINRVTKAIKCFMA
ncbi:MAG: aminotransferase class I/II-fold pyridoxal phosphate-dependent enzyme [Muribaculaceae bacterium]|nr:aminotransferase class I/II-fold pyridoxal phosphate-dependent enzyme [Muribaculaceae bacterium]